MYALTSKFAALFLDIFKKSRWNIPSFVVIGILVTTTSAMSTAQIPPELTPHLRHIASLAQTSPVVRIPAGWFLMGTDRRDADAFSNGQYAVVPLRDRRKNIQLHGTHQRRGLPECLADPL